jgi:DNA polymerase-1
MLEYRELSKLKGTYLDTLPQMVCAETGRIHAGFHQTGAITGRLSSSDPNLQNIPVRTEIGRRIRGAFVAGDDDHRLIVADYSQIELRILAEFSRDAALLEAFHAGQDIHATVAAQVNGVALDAVTGAQRSAAKAVNFGIIYGQTAFGLARGWVSAGQRPRISSTATTPVSRRSRRYRRVSSRRPRARLRRDHPRAAPPDRSIPLAQSPAGRARRTPGGQHGHPGQRRRPDQAGDDRHPHRHRVSGLSLRMLIQVHDELVFESPPRRADAHIRPDSRADDHGASARRAHRGGHRGGA